MHYVIARFIGINKQFDVSIPNIILNVESEFNNAKNYQIWCIQSIITKNNSKGNKLSY